MFHNVLKITHTPNFRFKSNHLIKFSLDKYLTYEKKTQQESSKFVSNVFALALLDFTNDKNTCTLTCQKYVIFSMMAAVKHFNLYITNRIYYF